MNTWKTLLIILFVILIFLFVVPAVWVKTASIAILAFLLHIFTQTLVKVVQLVGMEWTVYYSLSIIILLSIVFGKWVRSLIVIWRWRRSKDIGPIMVEEPEEHKDLAILMRQTLSQCGASCMNPAKTSAPNATPGFDNIGAVIEGVGQGSSKIIVALITILKELIESFAGKKHGFIVSYELSGDEKEGKVHIDIEIKLMHNGRLKKSYTKSGKSYREVITEAAYWIFWYISGRAPFLRMISPWYRFPTPDAYINYKKAQFASGKEKVEYFLESIREAPLNARARLELGDYYETRSDYWQALEVYIGAVFIWPHLYGFWYRIAAILSCPEEWVKKWQKQESAKPTHLEELIGALINDFKLDSFLLNRSTPEISKLIKAYKKKFPSLSLSDTQSRKANEIDTEHLQLTFYYYSLLIWAYLEEKINVFHAIGLWISQTRTNIWSWFVNPIQYSPHLAKYYWKIIPYFPWRDGALFARSVKIAKYCSFVELESTENIPQEIREKLPALQKINTEVEKEERRPWNDMNVKYNIACYHALVLSKVKDDKDGKEDNAIKGERREHYQKAMESLKIACKDSRTMLDSTWVLQDPDFKELKDYPQFSAIFDIQAKRTDEEQNKNFVWKLIRKGAEQQLIDWKKKSKKKLSQEELLIECEYQVALWKSLSTLMENPGAEKLRIFFWQKVNQNGDVIPLPEDDKKKENKPVDQTLWLIIESTVKAQQEIWEKNKENCQLFLQKQNENDQKARLLKTWAKGEIWVWNSFLKKPVEKKTDK